MEDKTAVTSVYRHRIHKIMLTANSFNLGCMKSTAPKVYLIYIRKNFFLIFPYAFLRRRILFLLMDPF
jgi:hypothetical protein